MNKLTEQQKKFLSDIFRSVYEHGTPMLAVTTCTTLAICYADEGRIDLGEMNEFQAKLQLELVDRNINKQEEHYKS